MHLKVFVERLIRYLFPEFDNHFSPNELQNLIDSEGSLGSLHALVRDHLKHAFTVFHHFNLYESGNFENK